MIDKRANNCIVVHIIDKRAYVGHARNISSVFSSFVT